MRLSVALLSAWTSASHRRGLFASGFVSWRGRTAASASYNCVLTGLSGRGRVMEPHPSKRFRTEGQRQMSMASSNADLLGRSPYERRMGKVISLCAKCQGEGRIRAPLSKKARARRKRMQQQQEGGGDASSTNRHDPPQMKACPACDGSGLIATAPSESEPDQPAPTVHPGVSVAIVGGGIGGIALAAALQHRRIPCVVYERDASFEERKQGYGLTMQQGARALRSLGFFSFSDGEEVAGAASDNEAEAMEPSKTRFGIHSTRHVVHTPDGTVVGEWGMKVWGGRFEKNGRQHAKRQNAHISRQGLRKLLMEMLLPGTVKWGHQFVGYSDSSVGSETSRLSLTFQRRLPEFRGAEEEFEEEVSSSATILVGCDGIRSVVRASKLGDDASPLRYLGCIVVLGIAASPASELTDGETVFQSADGTTRVYAMPFARPGDDVSGIDGVRSDSGLSMWQLSFPMDESDAKKLSQQGSSALKAEALRRCGEWHSPIPELLSQTPEDLVTGYPCYDRALVEKEVLREGCAASDTAANPFVTILGDACHPMSPFKGQGANQALLDAVLLARKLYSTLRTDRKKPEAGENNTLDRIPLELAQFEEEMLQRSAVKVKKSADAAKFLHTDQAIAEGNVTRGAAG